MKISRFTEVQVAYALRQAEAGLAVMDVYRSLGHILSDVLHLEEEVRRPKCHRGQAVAFLVPAIAVETALRMEERSLALLQRESRLAHKKVRRSADAVMELQ